MSVYNGEAYVDEAIRSILDQSYSDFEFIIVDDGSTDNTGDRLGAFADPRMSVLTSPHREGVGGAMKKALAAAKGELIARMDADDVSYRNRLARSVDILDAYPSVALVAGSADRLYVESGQVVRNYYTMEFGIPPLEPLEKHTAVVREKLSRENVICQPTVLVRRRVLEEVGFYRVPVVEDYDLWLRISERYPIVIAQEPWLLHRAHESSTSRRDWYAMRRYEWVVRRAAAMRRLGAKNDRVGFLELATRPASPIGVWIYLSGASAKLRTDGARLRAQGHLGAGYLVSGLGLSCALLTHPFATVKRVAEEVLPTRRANGSGRPKLN